MNETQIVLNFIWALIFLAVLSVLIVKTRIFPSSDRGVPILVIGMSGLMISSFLASLFNSVSFMTMVELATHYDAMIVMANLIRALSTLIVVYGILVWSQTLREHYTILGEKENLEERLSKQSDLLASQSRDLEIRTIDYLEQREATIEAERSKTNFLRNTSHEFRTPLNAIIGLSDLLMEGKANSGEEQREFAKMISDSGRKLLGIIDTLLDIARIKSGEYVANPKPTSLRSIIDECVTLQLPKAHAKSIRIQHAPEDDMNILAFFDSNATHHILNKLLDNAITYSPENTSILVTISEEDEDFTKVIITDEGPGIAPEYIETAFEIFGRAERWQHRGEESAGLGLALSAKMAEIQDGHLEIKSDGKKGTTCILSLPAHKDSVKKAS